MKLQNKKTFVLAILILLVLFTSYFIKFQVDEGSNYQTADSFLGVLIFHNPIILVIYITLGLILIFLSFKKLRIEQERERQRNRYSYSSFGYNYGYIPNYYSWGW